MCDDLYEQDARELKSRVGQVVGMAEVGVDLSWAEIGKERGQPLPESHPLVRTERSVWEVRAASKVLLSSLEDLELHKALVKRMKILVNCFSELSSVLVNGGENDSKDILRSTSLAGENVTRAGLSLRSLYIPEKSRLLVESLR